MLIVTASPVLQAAIVDALPVSVQNNVGLDLAFLPSTVNTIQLESPYRLLAGDGRLFFRFEVPAAQQIAYLNSLIVTLHVFDDEDSQGEAGIFEFLLPIGGEDLFIDSFGGVDGPLSSDPNTTYTGPVGCLCDALAAMQDNGRFRIRVSRDFGDFYVSQVDVAIDAEMVPEPTSFALLAFGLIGIAAVSRRRSNRSGRHFGQLRLADWPHVTTARE